MRRELTACLLASLVVGCQGDVTQALVTVRTSLTPAEMDEYTVSVSGPDGPSSPAPRGPFENDGNGEVGWSFGIVPKDEGDLDRRITIEAVGFLDDQMVARGRSGFDRFEADRTIPVDVRIERLTRRDGGVDDGGPRDGGGRDGGLADRDGGVDDGGAIDSGVRDGGVFDNDAGTGVWIRTVSNVDGSQIQDVVTSTNGTIVIGGRAESNVTIGGVKTPVGADDAFVAKLRDDGTHVWTVAFTGNGAQRVSRVALARDGSVFVSGYADDGMSLYSHAFGTVDQLNVDGRQAFLVHLDADGRHVQTIHYGGLLEDRGQGLQIVENTIYVTGWTQGRMEINQTNCAIDPPTAVVPNSRDVYVAAFDRRNLACLWLTLLGGDGRDMATSLDYDAEHDQVVVVGHYDGPFGTGLPSEMLPVAVDQDGFVVALRGQNGDFAVGVAAGGLGIDVVTDLEMLPGDRVMIGGRFDSDNVAIGATVLPMSENEVLLGASLRRGLLVMPTKVSFTHTNGTRDVHTRGIAVDAVDGRIVMTGSYQGTIDFGGNFGARPSNGGEDIFVVTIALSTGPIGVDTFGGRNQDRATATVHVPTTNRTVVVGWHNRSVIFPGGLQSVGGADDTGFILSY